jgi:hypothetical protein
VLHGSCRGSVYTEDNFLDEPRYSLTAQISRVFSKQNWLNTRSAKAVNLTAADLTLYFSESVYCSNVARFDFSSYSVYNTGQSNFSASGTSGTIH